MKLLQLIRPPDGWRIGTKLMVFTVPPVILVASLAAWAVWVRNEANLQEKLTQRARSLSNQIMAEREYYASVVVPKVQELGGTFGADYRQVHGRLPLPATLLREVSEILTGANPEGFAARLVSPWPINPAMGLTDEFQREAFAYLAAQPSGEYVRTEVMAGRPVLRVLRADRASAQSCVDCHNAHPQSPRRDFKLHDVMGGLEIVLPIGRYVQESRRDLLFTVAGGAGLCLLVLGVIALGTRRTISRPLALLAGLMEPAGGAGGGGSAPVFAPRGDEIGHLTDRFKELKKLVEAQQEELREANLRLEQRVAERTKALQVLEEQYRATVTSLPVSVVRLGKDFTVQFANRTFYRTFDRSPEETVGRPIGEAFPADRIEEVLGAVRLDRAGSGEVEVECLMPADRRHLFRLSVSCIGEPESGERVVVIEDQTERKRMEQQLRQADKLAALGTLLGGVAHELNNPLFIISGHAQLARSRLDRATTEGLQEDLAAIYEATHRASAIVSRFLGVARTAGGRREVCHVPGLIARTLELMANDLSIHQIAVRTNLPPDLPRVLADPQDLTQVLLNLMTNARQAMATAHGRGTLTVSASLADDAGTRGRGDAEKERQGDREIAASPLRPFPVSGREGGWVEVRVGDDGPGITPENQARIFEPFFTTKPIGEGTGLGLAICHRIVTELGGTLTVESDLGRGATFVIRLPVLVLEEAPGGSRPGAKDEASDREGRAPT
ncbi:MAG: ATP-binding protein [Nitrospirota bacterium]